MNTTRTIRVLVTVLALGGAATASAQQTTAGTTTATMPLDGKLFVGVNVGAQTRSSEVNNEFSFPLYRETATVSTTSTVGKGAIFDLSVGYRFMPMFGVAIGYTSFSNTGTAQGTGSIPSPVFFNRPAAVTISGTDAKRTDRTIYLVAVGFMPITDKMEVSGFIGPAATRVKQELIADATVPLGTQTVVSTIQNQSGTAKGINVGADLAYQILNQVGAGVFIRYISGSADLTTAQNVKAGGFQIGVGARLRF
jgi:hypothetical protein